MTVNAFSCAVEEQAQRRQIAARRDLEAIAERLHHVRRGDRMADRRLVQAERDERTQLEPDRLVRQQAIRDVRRVLQVRHHHALLEPDALDVVGPDRQARLEAKVDEIARAVEFLAARPSR